IASAASAPARRAAATRRSARSARAVWSRSEAIAGLLNGLCGSAIRDKAKMWPEIARFNPTRSQFARPRQPLVNHAARLRVEHELLTSLLKPIATAIWQCRGNRAATARGELKFRGVKWKPAGSLPGRAAQGHLIAQARWGPRCGSTPSL